MVTRLEVLIAENTDPGTRRGIPWVENGASGHTQAALCRGSPKLDLGSLAAYEGEEL